MSTSRFEQSSSTNPIEAEHQRLTTEANRARNFAEVLGIDSTKITEPTQDFALDNYMKTPHLRQKGEGVHAVESAVAQEVQNRMATRLEAAGIATDDAGNVIIQPESYGVAHEVTEALQAARSAVKHTVSASFDPSLDEHQRPIELVNSGRSNGYASELALYEMLGVSTDDFTNEVPNSFDDVRGGTIYHTAIKTPDGLLVEREDHLDEATNTIIFTRTKLLPLHTNE